MGNYKSCFQAQNTNSNIAKLVDSQGKLRLVNLPTTVAEIMLENPGFALSPVDELMQTRRVPVMKADDMLHGRKVYLLVPVDKVNSKLSDLQLTAIDTLISSTCNENVRITTRGGLKVSPIGGESLEEAVKGLSDKLKSLACKRNGFSKAWEPVLEPILEAC